MVAYFFPDYQFQLQAIKSHVVTTSQTPMNVFDSAQQAHCFSHNQFEFCDDICNLSFINAKHVVNREIELIQSLPSKILQYLVNMYFIWKEVVIVVCLRQNTIRYSNIMCVMPVSYHEWLYAYLFDYNMKLQFLIGGSKPSRR